MSRSAKSGAGDIVASVLPSFPNFFVEVETQTFTGRLTCADPRPAFYNCGHTKQSVWGCKPDCFIEPAGSQYVLESSGRSYSVIGDPKQIRPFLKDEVTVTGKLKGETIKAVSIAKTSKKARFSGMRSEDDTHQGLTVLAAFHVRANPDKSPGAAFLDTRGILVGKCRTPSRATSSPHFRVVLATVVVFARICFNLQQSETCC